MRLAKSDRYRIRNRNNKNNSDGDKSDGDYKNRKQDY